MVRGISLVGIGSPEEVLAIRRRFPDACFELPYNLRSLDGMAEAASGRIASLHSLCPRRDFFPNFASDDDAVVSWSSEEMMKDAMTARQLGASVLVLHPGYLIPSLVPSEKNARLRLMESGELDRFVGISSGSICREDYISRPEYRAAFERMLPNLRELSDRLEKMGIILAVENLNPRAGYMLVHPDEMVEIAERTKLHFALDIGHLHVSAERFGLDFLHSLERILSTGRIVTTHLHSNPSDRKKGIFLDSHQSLDGFSMPWKDALSMIENSGANMMLETVEDPMHNLELLFC